MTVDRIHRLAGFLMWGGVAVALIVVLALPEEPTPLAPGLFALSALLAAVGAIVKKRTCPHCRGGRGACSVPPERSPR